MNVFKRKNRMISFRVSEEEFNALQRSSISHGSRSVSDFARDSLFRLLEDRSGQTTADALGTRIDELASEFRSLTRDVESLRNLVRLRQG